MYNHYSTPETTLVLNYQIDVPKNHEARLISLFVDSIPEGAFYEKTSATGRPTHHSRTLLKMLLFAYSRGVYSGRQIAQINEEVIPMKWLSCDEYVMDPLKILEYSLRHLILLKKLLFIFPYC